MKKANVELYAPGALAQLSKEHKEALKNLTREEVAELAAAHPNQANSVPYLVLRDKTKKPNEQLYPRSTWHNYNELLKLNQSHYEIAGTVHDFKPEQDRLKVAEEQDLTTDESRKELAGLKTAPVQNAAAGTVKRFQQDRDIIVNDGENQNTVSDDLDEEAAAHADQKAKAKEAKPKAPRKSAKKK